MGKRWERWEIDEKIALVIRLKNILSLVAWSIVDL